MKELISILKRNANKIAFGDVTGNGVKSIVLHDHLAKEDLDIIESNISDAGIICYLTNGIASISEEYLYNLQKSLDSLNKDIISERQFIYLLLLQHPCPCTDYVSACLVRLFSHSINRSPSLIQSVGTSRIIKSLIESRPPFSSFICP
jgi:hypothetical protein